MKLRVHDPVVPPTSCPFRDPACATPLGPPAAEMCTHWCWRKTAVGHNFRELQAVDPRPNQWPDGPVIDPFFALPGWQIVGAAAQVSSTRRPSHARRFGLR